MEGLTLGLVTATVLMGILGRSVHVGAERDPMSPPFMERSPDSIAMPLHDMTTLICKMNIPTENFTWRHYPLVDPTRPNATLNLANAVYKEVPSKYIRSDNLTTEVQITLDSESKAGDYQCLARYGASVVASIPGRITKSVLEKFPPQNNTVITVSPGNTVIWWCELPYSNPPPFVDYYKDGSYVLPRHNLQSLTQSLIIPDVTEKDSGIYKCRVGNSLSGSKQESKASLILNVVRNGWKEETRFVREPKKTYTVVKGQTALLECPLVGNPVPTIKWSKHNGNLPENRVQNKYNSLKITNVTSSDEGVYICLYNNKDFKITLLINEAPIIIEGPENRDVHEGEDLDLECTVRGTPEPIVSWILNGNSVTNDSSIEAVGNRLYFRPVGKNHAGILQCFVSNEIATVYRSAYLKVIPKQRSSTDFDGIPTPITNGHARKPKKPRKPNRGGKGRTAQMIPPDRPTISRLNDEAVVVRWSVPPNQGLPIQFFKVQYRELGAVNETHSRGKGSKWMTTNADIPPHIFSYEVSDLKPNYYYKFRIAAVYSNNDNKISPHSQKFLLDRQDFFLRNPLPVPKLTHTEPINSTAIKIYWELTPVSNITLDGFYINYMLSSNAGDFTRATVEGENTRSYIINHLQPDTMYDIKLQSFTTNSASEFSGILKQKTMKDLSVESSTRTPSVKSPPADDASALYIYIATGVIGVLLVASLAVLLVVCRKWKKKKNADNRGDDKPAVDDGHHIQADAGDYVVNSKSLSRTNGCIPANRMNITANPLADADNKNQNMIEMSCLSSQNNNCSQPSASTQESLPCDSLKSKKNRDKSKRSKNSGLPPSENYV